MHVHVLFKLPPPSLHRLAYLLNLYKGHASALEFRA